MAAGLWVWDAAGISELTVTDRIFRELGAVQTGTTPNSIFNPGLSGGSPWYVVLPLSDTFKRQPAVSVDSNALTISWTGTGFSNGLLVYGVY